MKRLMIILAVTAAIFASCSKSEPETGNKDANESGNITLKLSVSEFGGGDSKAPIKTGWAEGDQLLIWFDENAGEKPDMVIKNNGSGWEKDGAAQVSGKKPSASGKMKVLYNNILCVTANDPYTFNSVTSTLSGRIQTWTFLTEIQVVVKDLDKTKAAGYTLSCSNFTPFTGYTVGTESITATAGVANTAVSGMSNADGVAFVFASCTEYGKSAGYKFTLKDGSSSGASASTPTTPECVEIEAKYDGTNLSKLKWAKWNVGASKPEEYGYYFFWGDTQGYILGTAKDYTLTKTLARNVSQIKGIKIAGSKFSSRNCWVTAEKGVELVGGFCWENMPHTDGIYSPSSNTAVFTKYVPQSQASTFGKDGFYDDKTTLDPADDAACKYLGGSWRMPTIAEFQAMKKATYWAWDAIDKGYYVYAPNPSTDAGMINDKRHGIYNKSNALLFFPAAGRGFITSLSDAGSDGCYWSSGLRSSEPLIALILGFRSSYVYPDTGSDRSFGNTVRPVSD